MNFNDIASTSSNVSDPLSPVSALNKQLEKLAEVRKQRRASRKTTESIRIGIIWLYKTIFILNFFTL